MKGKKTSKFSLKRLLQDNSVPIMFVLICLICLPLAGYSPAYLLNELITRMGRNTFLILALLIPQCTDRLHTITAVLAAFFSVALHLAGLHQWNVVLATILAATMGTLLARRAKPGEAA